MPKLFKIPLIFLFIGSLLGVFLRWQFISPSSGINYIFVLHGHSHVMFLGWIFNVLYLAFVYNHIPTTGHKFYKTTFYILQIVTVGMLISFPLQGYGFWSILFSTIHTFGALVFCARFLFQTKEERSLSIWYSRAALVFFILSAAGPFFLGYIMANNLSTSNWNNFAIYFYLHFQYNGFFFFGILSLFFRELETMEIPFDLARVKATGWLFAIACVPAYALSTLWAKPGYFFNFLGMAAALVQCVALFLLVKVIWDNKRLLRQKFRPTAATLLQVALLSLIVKILLQVASCFPAVAQLALELRPVVIAYLHLVLLGVISAFLFGWYIQQGLLETRMAKRATMIFMGGFFGMEVALVISPWVSGGSSLMTIDSAEYNLLFAVMVSLSIFLLLLAQKNMTKVRI
jgi:hypothetical protein